jgi:hypothetical protein
MRRITLASLVFFIVSYIRRSPSQRAFAERQPFDMQGFGHLTTLVGDVWQTQIPLVKIGSKTNCGRGSLGFVRFLVSEGLAHVSKLLGWSQTRGHARTVPPPAFRIIRNTGAIGFGLDPRESIK